jgi:sulfatase modifying factor 1
MLDRAFVCALLSALTVTGCAPTASTPAPTEASAPTEANGSGERPAPPPSEASTEPAEASTEPAEPAPDPATLGPGGRVPDACREIPREGTACIPGGWYVKGLPEDTHGCDQMGQPRDLRPMSQPELRVWLSTFEMDRTEVTFAAYQECVEAGECPRARPLYRGFSSPDQPMTGVSWFDARAYCIWRGGDLPTEAQFEAAARGPDGEWYPWGNDEGTCDLAILMNDQGRSCGRPQPSDTPDRGVVWPVASRPAGRFGLYDIAGNAEEWVLDWWTPDYSECADTCGGVDPRGPCDGAEECPGRRYRTVRGGSWYWDGTHAAGWHRRRHEPDNDPFHHFGFRCVY